MHRVLVTDDVDSEGVALLLAEPTLQVDVVPTLPVPELLERIGDYDAIVGRSATRISRELLERHEAQGRRTCRCRHRQHRPRRRHVARHGRHQRSRRQHGRRGRAVLRGRDRPAASDSARRHR
jgi:hypothetical protein